MSTKMDKEEKDRNFAKLKCCVSNWFDINLPINMLRVLYTDHIPFTSKLYECKNTRDIVDMLVTSGHLSQNDLTLLSDTIKATQLFGLEQEIENQFPSYNISKKVRDNAIKSFSLHRQRLVKLGMALTPGDVEKISQLYDLQHTESWSLIIDLEHNTTICEENIGKFIETLDNQKLRKAVKALTEEVIQVGLRRRRPDEPTNHLRLITELSDNIESLPLGDIPQFCRKLSIIDKHFKKVRLHLNYTSDGSVIFHLSVFDPYALMNLWEIHLRGELTKDLAAIIVPDNLQDDFIREWKTSVDREEYESALMRLKQRVQYDSFICIISDDTEWENNLVEDLQQRRPDLKCNIIKHWRLSQPETVHDLISKSMNVIIAFSPILFTDYSKYSAHSVVVEMLEANALDVAKIIPVKLSEECVVPSVFASVTAITAGEEHFVDKVLAKIDECGYNQLTSEKCELAPTTEANSDFKFTETFENTQKYSSDEVKKDIHSISKNTYYSGVQKIPSTNTHSCKYRQVIEQLKLNDYYPKILSLEKALAVSEFKISADDLNDTGNIPWYILQNLIMGNYKGRCFEVRQKQSCYPVIGTLNVCDDAVDVSPSDALVALFMCCDDFLRQLLVEKLSMCQLAIPLLLPTDTNQNTMEMLLWAMRSLRKQWKTNSGLLCDKSMAVYPLPIVSAIRFGRPMISKSKILNKVISDIKHDIFFNYECDGGALERKISEGILEITWYFPSGKHHNILTEALSFMNLRGNASHFKNQREFISEISFVTIAFMLAADLIEKDIVSLIKSLYNQKGHLILVVDGYHENYLKDLLCTLEQTSPSIKNKQVKSIFTSNKNELQISKEIRRKILRLFKGKVRSNVPDKSLEDLIDVARKNGFQIDESAKDCSVAKSMAGLMFSDLKPLGKKQLPLQSISIEIGKTKKEEYRLKLKGNMEIEKYMGKVHSKITTLRNHQNDLFKEQPGLSQLFSISYTYSLSVRRYFYSYVKIIGDRYSIDNLSSLSLGIEHFNREIGQIYEMKSSLKLLDNTTRQFPVIAAEMLLHGNPLELMDGDASHVPDIWIEAVLTSLMKRVGNKRIFVLSVLGIQNGGKSMMLNTMFGLQFPVSAGRCTKGVFAQLLTLDSAFKENCAYEYILVVNTEGLRAPELARTGLNLANDLATLVIGLGDASIISVIGENATEMQGILQIAVHAFMKMKIVNIKPRSIFVHQNTTAERNTARKRTIKELLDELTRCAANDENCPEKYQTFSDVIQFQEDKNLMYISSLWRGDSPMAPLNPRYSECIWHVKRQIIKLMQESINATTVNDFKRRLKDLWKAILCENFVFSFKNTTEIKAYTALELEYLEHSRTLRRNAMTYIDSLQIKCKKLSANVIEKEGKIVSRQYISKFEEDVKMCHKFLQEYFARETQAFQWKSTTEIKIDKLCQEIRNEINDAFESIRKKIIGRANFDSNIKLYENDILKKAKSLAGILRDNLLSQSDLRREFDYEWTKWDANLPLCILNIDIKSSLEVIFQSVFTCYDTDITHMFSHSITGNVSEFDTTVTETDLDFNDSGEHVERIFHLDIDKATYYVDKANSIIEKLKSNVSKHILHYSSEGKNYSARFGYLLTVFIKNTLQRAKINSRVTFKRRGIHRIATCIILSMTPKLNNLQEKFREENDLKSYMETRKGRFWQMFRDEYMMVEISIRAASFISRELENAIQNSLPSKCKGGVIDCLHTFNKSTFANKMSFHAQMLIDFAEKNDFDIYRKYLPDPYHCMRNHIGKCIQEMCLTETENKLPILQQIYCEKLQGLFVLVEKAINDVCRACDNTCKISIWWNILLQNIGSDLDVKQELRFVNEHDSVEVEDLKRRLLTELNESKEKIKKAFQGDIYLQHTLEPCQQFFEKDLLGCAALCPFCKAPCDMQAGDTYDDHRTEYHRPLGVSGIHWETTKKLDVSICTTNVMSTDQRFTCEETNNKYIFYKDYQNVNKYYSSWKIQPMASDTQLYWKWFMAKYNENLAEYYNVEKGDIPDEWKNISWESVKEEMIKTYHL